MKRLLQAAGILSLCIVLAGCNSDSREGLIDDTVSMMNQAATEMGNIKNRVNEAVESVKSGKSTKLDLSEAAKAADKLKEAGQKTLEIKARIEREKTQITEEERKNYAANKQEVLNSAFKNLLTRQDELRQSLIA